MKNLEQQETEPKIPNIITDEKFIDDIKALQEEELANAQKLKYTGGKIPLHVKEFLLIEPKFLSELDKEAFEKFQDFMERKDRINSKEELEEFINYFKQYQFISDNSSQQFKTVKQMREQHKSDEEIKNKIQEINKQQEGIADNSKFFVNYINNIIAGESILLIHKLNL